MSDENKERRCKSCGKLLIDEKVPFCRRCVLSGRNTVAKIGGFVGGTAVSVISAIALINNEGGDGTQA